MPDKKDHNCYNIPKDGTDYIHGTWTIEGNAAKLVKEKQEEIKKKFGSCGKKRAIQTLLCELYHQRNQTKAA